MPHSYPLSLSDWRSNKTGDLRITHIPVRCRALIHWAKVTDESRSLIPFCMLADENNLMASAGHFFCVCTIDSRDWVKKSWGYLFWRSQVSQKSKFSLADGQDLQNHKMYKVVNFFILIHWGDFDVFCTSGFVCFLCFLLSAPACMWESFGACVVEVLNQKLLRDD